MVRTGLSIISVRVRLPSRLSSACSIMWLACPSRPTSRHPSVRLRFNAAAARETSPEPSGTLLTTELLPTKSAHQRTDPSRVRRGCAQRRPSELCRAFVSCTNLDPSSLRPRGCFFSLRGCVSNGGLRPILDTLSKGAVYQDGSADLALREVLLPRVQRLELRAQLIRLQVAARGPHTWPPSDKRA